MISVPLWLKSLKTKQGSYLRHVLIIGTIVETAGFRGDDFFHDGWDWNREWTLQT